MAKDLDLCRIPNIMKTTLTLIITLVVATLHAADLRLGSPFSESRVDAVRAPRRDHDCVVCNNYYRVITNSKKLKGLEKRAHNEPVGR